MQHHVKLNQTSAGKYVCTGAVSITSTPTPILDAARELKAAGADDADILSVSCGDVSIIPQTIGAILRPRPAPPKFALGYHLQ